MGCLLVLLALMLPRVAMIVIFLFTPWFEEAFSFWVWPVLGFLFLPYTTLAYTAAVLNSAGPMNPWWFILIGLAVLADLLHWSKGYTSRRRLTTRRFHD